MIAWSREAVHIIRGLFENNLAEYNAFGRFRSHSMSLVRADGRWISTTAACARAKADGTLLFDTSTMAAIGT